MIGNSIWGPHVYFQTVSCNSLDRELFSALESHIFYSYSFLLSDLQSSPLTAEQPASSEYWILLRLVTLQVATSFKISLKLCDDSPSVLEILFLLYIAWIPQLLQSSRLELIPSAEPLPWKITTLKTFTISVSSTHPDTSTSLVRHLGSGLLPCFGAISSVWTCVLSIHESRCHLELDTRKAKGKPMNCWKLSLTIMKLFLDEILWKRTLKSWDLDWILNENGKKRCFNSVLVKWGF